MGHTKQLKNGVELRTLETRFRDMACKHAIIIIIIIILET